MALTLPFFHINDVFLTGFCAELCHCPRLDLPGLELGIAGEPEKVKISLETLLVHYLKSSAEMRMMDRKFAWWRRKVRNVRARRRDMAKSALRDDSPFVKLAKLMGN